MWVALFEDDVSISRCGGSFWTRIGPFHDIVDLFYGDEVVFSEMWVGSFER